MLLELTKRGDIELVKVLLFYFPQKEKEDYLCLDGTSSRLSEVIQKARYGLEDKGLDLKCLDDLLDKEICKFIEKTKAELVQIHLRSNMLYMLGAREDVLRGVDGLFNENFAKFNAQEVYELYIRIEYGIQEKMAEKEAERLKELQEREAELKEAIQSIQEEIKSEEMSVREIEGKVKIQIGYFLNFRFLPPEDFLMNILKNKISEEGMIEGWLKPQIQKANINAETAKQIIEEVRNEARVNKYVLDEGDYCEALVKKLNSKFGVELTIGTVNEQFAVMENENLDNIDEDALLDYIKQFYLSEHKISKPPEPLPQELYKIEDEELVKKLKIDITQQEDEAQQHLAIRTLLFLGNPFVKSEISFNDRIITFLEVIKGMEVPEEHKKAVEEAVDYIKQPDVFYNLVAYCIGNEGEKQKLLLDLLKSNKYINMQNIFDIKDKDGNTFLHFIVKQRNLKTLRKIFPPDALLDINSININVTNNDGKTLMDIAMQNKDAGIVMILIDNGAIFNNTIENVKLLINSAVKENVVRFIDFLIEKNEGINFQDEHGRTPLHLALYMNNTEMAKLLIEKGVNIEIQDNIGLTPLHLALDMDNTEIAKLLIEKGANIEIQDERYGQTPLHLALEKDNTEMAKLLIEKGVNLDLQDQYARTPLNVALEKDNTEMAKLLIEKGANTKIQNGYGQTPLHLALEMNNTEIAKLLIHSEKNLLINFLIEENEDINFQDINGRTPIHLALEKDNTEMAKLLIEKGVNLNLQDKNDRTPLHLALEKDNTEIAKLLIEKGANLNLQDKSIRTPLHLALEMNNTEMAKLLIEKGANLDLQDQYARTPLYLALYTDNKEIAKLLIEKGANLNLQDERHGLTPLHLALEINNAEMAKLLIEKGANLNLQDERHGLTPLHLAIVTDNTEIAKLLIEKGVNLNLQEEFDRTPLHLAIGKNNTAIAKLLIEKGANSRIEDNLKCISIYIAIYKNNMEIAKLLIEKEADFDNLKDNEGNTLFHTVIEYNKTELVKLLIAKEVNPNLKNDKDQTPLHLAIIYGDKKLVELLLEVPDIDLEAKDDQNKTAFDLANDRTEILAMLNAKKEEQMKQASEVAEIFQNTTSEKRSTEGVVEQEYKREGVRQRLMKLFCCFTPFFKRKNKVQNKTIHYMQEEDVHKPSISQEI